MKYRRNPAQVHAMQLDPADIASSIADLDAFLAPGFFDYNLGAEYEDDLAKVLTYPHRIWETVRPGDWVVRWYEDCYTIIDDDEFKEDWTEIPE